MAHITKRGDAYRIVVSIGYTVDGRQVQKTKTWRPDKEYSPTKLKKKLEDVAREFELECQNRAVGNGHIKFETFIEQYFTESAELDLKHRTAVGYRSMKPRVVNALGHFYLDEITPRHIKSFMGELRQDGANPKNGKGFSPKTITNYLSFLSAIFACALDMELVRDNPCSKVKAPPREKKRPDWYTLEEAQVLLNTLLADAPLKYQAFFVTAMIGGYRREELCGFEWQSDINFNLNTIAVNRASLYTKDRGVYTDVPKTPSSRRVLKQPAIIFDVLYRWKIEQDTQATAMGDLWQNSGRVFTTSDGRPMHPNTPYGWLKKFCAKHSIRFLGVHAFRHLNAALLIYSGADIEAVAANLGHSQPSTTLNIYAYEFAQARAAASQAVADMVVGKMTLAENNDQIMTKAISD